MKITLKAARVMAGMTLKDAAEQVGYKRASLWRWESGQSPVPPVIKTALCRMYGVDEEEIRE